MVRKGKQKSTGTISTSNNNSSNKKKTNKTKQYQNTGGLRKLPVVKPGKELIAKARKIVYNVSPDT